MVLYTSQQNPCINIEFLKYRRREISTINLVVKQFVTIGEDVMMFFFVCSLRCLARLFCTAGCVLFQHSHSWMDRRREKDSKHPKFFYRKKWTNKSRELLQRRNKNWLHTASTVCVCDLSVCEIKNTSRRRTIRSGIYCAYGMMSVQLISQIFPFDLFRMWIEWSAKHMAKKILLWKKDINCCLPLKDWWWKFESRIGSIAKELNSRVPPNEANKHLIRLINRSDLLLFNCARSMFGVPFIFFLSFSLSNTCAYTYTFWMVLVGF